MIVRVYTKPDCWPCRKTKELFEQEGVEFVEEDATKPENLEALKALSFLSAPVVCAGLSDDDMWAGFQPHRIMALAERIRKENSE